MELRLDQALQKGIEAHKAGKVQEADQYYTAILKAQPKHPDANHNMGVLAVGVGKVEEALPFFKTALEANSSISQFWLSYINALIKLNRMADAKSIFDKAKSRGAKGDGFDQIEKSLDGIEPKSSISLNVQEPTQGLIQNLVNLYKQGQYQEALTEASQLLEKFPASINLYNILGAINHGSGNLEEAIEAYKKALSIKPDYAEALNNLGNVLKDQGKLDEAIVVYNKAISIKSDYAEVYNNLGNTFKDQGKLQAAIQAYKKALSIKPDYQKAWHMLSALTGNTPKTAPREYVENLFDRYSKRFEPSLVDELEYKIPKLIRNILIKPDSNTSLGSVLDLGCGTGLLGLEIRNHCSNLEGVDLSSEMLKLAKEKNVYDKLSHLDIGEYLSSVPLDFDYFISLDVFIYVGELTEIFRAIKSRNKKPGHLVFSTEHAELDGYHILKSGRYSHSKSYIESLCKKFGYNITHFSTTKLRKDNGSFLTGGIYTLEFKNKI